MEIDPPSAIIRASNTLIAKQAPAVVLREYLLRHAVFRDLEHLQVKGWENKFGDEHFALRREKANQTDTKGRWRLFNMMKNISEEMQDATGAFSFDHKMIQVLDLCMAPGGFAAYSLEKNPMGTVDAFSLPESEGGHPVLASKRDTRIRVHFADITMWPEELGVDNVPDNHPDTSKFFFGWPYECRAYDLVICDGQALHTQQVAEYRRRNEQTRLINSQLILGLRRIKAGGTLILLLHKPYKWRCLKLLYMFSRFSDIQLFKPKKYHAEKSSFYLIAKNVQPKTEEAVHAIDTFRSSWVHATFGTDLNDTDFDDIGKNDAELILTSIGPAFLTLARPIWAIQAAALAKAAWMKSNDE